MTTPIIAFSKDWHEDPTSNHHVLRELAKTRRVLWLNSLATRTPDLGSARDLKKLERKLREARRGPKNVENDLWIATPIVLPLPHSPLARACNRHILRASLRVWRLQLDIARFQLWTFLPNTSPYVGTLGEALAVYYCVDEWSAFPGLDRDATVALERQLLEKVDVTFATSLALRDAKAELCLRTHHAPHGVDHAKFARALSDLVRVPDDLAVLPRPRIGFFGTLRDLIDVDLLAAIARARPDWTLALIGQQLTNLDVLRGLRNVHLLGQKPHDTLPSYCKGFDVGLIPYRIDGNVGFVNPLKLREYLSAGLPVVSTAMPEVEAYAHLCEIGETPTTIVAAIGRALAGDSLARRFARSAAMANESWSVRTAQIEAIVAEVDRHKQRADALARYPIPVPRVGAAIGARR